MCVVDMIRFFLLRCSTVGAFSGLPFERPSGNPKRIRVNAFGVDGQDLVVQLPARLRCLSDAVEVADVLTRLFDDPRVVGAFSTLVTGDDYVGGERFDGIERTDHLLSFLPIRLGEVEVDVVIGDVSGNNQGDRGAGPNGAPSGAARSTFDAEQSVAFQ